MKSRLRKKSARRMRRTRTNAIDLVQTIERALANPRSEHLNAMHDQVIRLQRDLTTLLTKRRYAKRKQAN